LFHEGLTYSGFQRMKRLTFCFVILIQAWPAFSQDLPLARHYVDTLASSTFWGRGYTKNGMAKAADFIETEFKRIGLLPFDGKYKQAFHYPVNTFPGKVAVSVDGKKLTPGLDFIVAPESRGVQASGKLFKQDSIRFYDGKNKIELILRDKLTWGVLPEVANYTRIEVLKSAISKNPVRMSVNIENKLIPKFEASNVCGYVRGTQVPDSILVIAAHYDHLGGLGIETYFPGANDNASGIALLLSLAQHYAAHPLRYSVVFIAFGGEEAGLRGSEFFIKHPLFAINNIRFLTNLDLTGTGEEGIAVVNATIFKEDFEKLFAVVQAENLFARVKQRGKAANSDHYWFTERGVPSFFIYAMGGIQAYHDVHDRVETLPLTEFADLFRMIVGFQEAICR
jgi:aminopeptidase YwaD